MDQVRSFFHEMGHGLHNVLSVTECARFHGTRVERDFVEAPSMMFEYFFWTPLHIKEVSHHYSYLSPNYEQTWRAENPEAQDLPPLQLPDDTVGKLLRLKHTNKPLSLLKNLHFSLYDMIVHTPASHEELSAMNFCEVFNKTRNDIMGLQGGEALGEGWEWAHFESLFRHINGGSYDVGYYAYVM
jgi:metallopeptidase MepB